MTDDFRQNERIEGRTLIIDGAEFADTREKLEAEVRRTLTDPDDWHAWVQYHTALEWLDRQVAITARECEAACGKCEDDQDSLVAQMAEEIADLEAQLEEVSRAYKERGKIIAKLMANECDNCEPMHAAEHEIHELRAKLARQAEATGEFELRCKGLESERDELKAFADRVRGAVIKGNDLTIFGADYVPADAYYSILNTANAIARNTIELRNEVNQLRKVVQIQADSFAKLERELAMAKEEQ